MYDKCPSKSMRNLRAVKKICRNCGGEVEMFSDELRIRCKTCRQFVYKEQLPHCIEGYAGAAVPWGRVRVEGINPPLRKGDNGGGENKRIMS